MPDANSNSRRTRQSGDSTRAIGLMSGTSADGIDGVLLAVKSSSQVEIEDSVHIAFPSAVQKQINAIINQPTANMDELGRLNTHLGELYAHAANQLKAKSTNEKSAAVAVIGCHGQTIRHAPCGEYPFTLQLGNGALIAQRTGIPTVCDFRSADLAIGGQGAPLTPAFHRAVFASENETRAVINLGGIANITHLPAAGHLPTTGFDTGPANTLLDNWCQRHFNEPFDTHGGRAAGGEIKRNLLEKLLTDPYFARPPPKSTGREYFNVAWLDSLMTDNHFTALTPTDILTTLTALTAMTISTQLNRLTPAVESAYLCGGGVRNQTLINMLRERCHCDLQPTTKLGIGPQWVEACAFAWLGFQTLQRNPAILPSVTGARKATIAGAIYFPN